MNNLSFKNRIALYYMLATASIMVLVFLIIFFVVQSAVYGELDEDLAFEAHKHTEEIYIKGDSIFFINKNEWQEREHIEVQVNPVFIQVVNKDGALMDKSPNLKEDNLLFFQDKAIDQQFDTELKSQVVRQIQIPIMEDGKTKGYIMAAMSLEGSKIVLDSLRKNLFLLFPLVLIGLFFITRFLAGRSIIPVKVITETTDRITRHSLNERIDLPTNKDELFTLTSSINELLDRLADTIEREKQFTSDASHQLRTPLAVLKGTLEVLVRKPRSSEEYTEKIIGSIKEIDRLSEIVNQLLLLARFDNASQELQKHTVNLLTATDTVLHRYKNVIQKKELKINVFNETKDSTVVTAHSYYIDLILDNILSNAIKYSNPKSAIDIHFLQNTEQIICLIQDYGIGIKMTDLPQVFNPFYRSNALVHKEISGNGLGLSIVKKAADLLGVEVLLSSEFGTGTVVELRF